MTSSGVPDMPDLLRPLIQGMAVGNQKNRDRAEAEVKAKADAYKIQRDNLESDRTYALKLTTQSQVVRKAAETEWKDIEDFTMSGTYDRIMLPQVLARARRLDESYPGVLPQRAEPYFAQAMNASQSPRGNEHGPPSPEVVKASPMYGYRTPAQKDNVETAARDARTKRVLASVRKEGADYINKYSIGPNGTFDPAYAGAASLKFVADISERYDLDPRVIDAEIDDLHAEIVKMNEGNFVTPEDKAKQEALWDKRSRDGTAWARSVLGKRNSMIPGPDEFLIDKNDQQLFNRIDKQINKYVKMNLDLPVIKGEIYRRFTTGGKWINGSGKLDPWAKAIAVADPRFMPKVQELYNQGVDSDMYEPFWDPEAKSGGLKLSPAFEGRGYPRWIHVWGAPTTETIDDIRGQQFGPAPDLTPQQGGPKSDKGPDGQPQGFLDDHEQLQNFLNAYGEVGKGMKIGAQSLANAPEQIRRMFGDDGPITVARRDK